MQSLFRRTPAVRKEDGRRMSMGQLSGASALHDAVAKGKLHLARFILDAVDGEGPVNSKDKHGKTPLLRAVRVDNDQMRTKVIALLLKHSADVNAMDNIGRTPLSYACEFYRNDVVTTLLKNNVDPNLADNDGNTPLMYCALSGNSEGIEILAKSFRRLGLEVDKMNADGVTPLIIAVKQRDIRCASCLIQEGKASTEIKDSIHKKTAIDWAKASGWTLNEMNTLKTKFRPTARIDQPYYSSSFSSNDSSSEQINNIAKRSHQRPKSRNYLTVKRELESRARSNSAPRETCADYQPKGRKFGENDVIRNEIYDLDGKTASLPELIFSSTAIRCKTEIKGKTSPVLTSGVGSNGIFIKRGAKKTFRRPFSGNIRAPLQSKSFDSALSGRASSSLENLCDRCDNAIHGKKQKYLLSADSKQLISLVPLSRSSEALPRYTKLRGNDAGGSQNSDSSDTDYVSIYGVDPPTTWRRDDECTTRSNSSTPQLPPLI